MTQDLTLGGGAAYLDPYIAMLLGTLQQQYNRMALQEDARQFGIGTQESARQFNTQIAEHGRQFNAGLTEDARQFNESLKQKYLDRELERLALMVRSGVDMKSIDAQLAIAAQEVGVRLESIRMDFQAVVLGLEQRENEFARTHGLEVAKFLVDKALAEATLRANPRDMAKYIFYVRNRHSPAEAAQLATEGRVLDYGGTQPGRAPHEIGADMLADFDARSAKLIEDQQKMINELNTKYAGLLDFPLEEPPPPELGLPQLTTTATTSPTISTPNYIDMQSTGIPQSGGTPGGGTTTPPAQQPPAQNPGFQRPPSPGPGWVWDPNLNAWVPGTSGGPSSPTIGDPNLHTVNGIQQTRIPAPSGYTTDGQPATWTVPAKPTYYWNPTTKLLQIGYPDGTWKGFDPNAPVAVSGLSPQEYDAALNWLKMNHPDAVAGGFNIYQPTVAPATMSPTTGAPIPTQTQMAMPGTSTPISIFDAAKSAASGGPIATAQTVPARDMFYYNPTTQLIRKWDEGTSNWLAYDPAAPSALNTLPQSDYDILKWALPRATPIRTEGGFNIYGQLAEGGTVKGKKKSKAPGLAVVGEGRNGEGFRMGTAELMIVPEGEAHIVPLPPMKFLATGGSASPYGSSNYTSILQGYNPGNVSRDPNVLAQSTLAPLPDDLPKQIPFLRSIQGLDGILPQFGQFRGPTDIKDLGIGPLPFVMNMQRYNRLYPSEKEALSSFLEAAGLYTPDVLEASRRAMPVGETQQVTRWG